MKKLQPSQLSTLYTTWVKHGKKALGILGPAGESKEDKIPKNLNLFKRNRISVSMFLGCILFGLVSPPVKADSAIYYVNLGSGRSHYFSAFAPTLERAQELAWSNCASTYLGSDCSSLSNITGGGWVAVAKNSSWTQVHAADSRQMAELGAMNNCWLNSGFTEPCAVVHVYHDTN